MSKHTTAIRLVIASTISVMAAAVFADSPHYKHGGEPVCTINSINGTATCTSGSVAGLGNADVEVTVSLSATAGTFCHNPGNGDVVPGQNPATAVGSSSQFFGADQIKNGTLTIPPISVTVTVATPSPGAAGCPNDSWSVTLGPVTYGPGFYSFEQPPGTVVPGLSFSF